MRRPRNTLDSSRCRGAPAAAPSLASRQSGFFPSTDGGKGGRGRRPSRRTPLVGSRKSRHNPPLRSSMDDEENCSLKIELIRGFGRARPPQESARFSETRFTHGLGIAVRSCLGRFSAVEWRGCRTHPLNLPENRRTGRPRHLRFNTQRRRSCPRTRRPPTENRKPIGARPLRNQAASRFLGRFSSPRRRRSPPPACSRGSGGRRTSIPWGAPDGSA